MRSVYRFLIPALVLSTLCCAAIRADSLKYLRKDEWAGAYVMGTKIGYGHHTASVSTFEGKTVYKLERLFVAAGNGVTAQMANRVYIDADFRPLFETQESSDSQSPDHKKKIDVRYLPQTVECRAEANGKVETKSVPVPKNADLSAYCQYSCDLKRPVLGEKLVMTCFSLEDLKFKVSTVYLGQRAKIDVKGATIEATPVVEESDGDTNTDWCTDDWKLVKTEAYSGALTAFPESREEAIAGFGKDSVFVAGRETIKADMDILASVTDLDTFNRLTGLGVRLVGVRDSKLAVCDGRQTARVLADEDAIEYIIKTEPFNPSKAAKLPLAGPECEKWLPASSMIQSDDKAIVALARETVGGEKNAYKAALKLRNWVNSNLEGDEVSSIPVSASDALKARKGDCKHFSVLLAAFCRAAGIPCRVVVGLVPCGEKQFGYHAWVECFVGEWVPLDATGCWESMNAMYIKLAVMESDEWWRTACAMLSSNNAQAKILYVAFSPANVAPETPAVAAPGGP